VFTLGRKVFSLKRHSIAAVTAVLILGATLTAVPAQAAVAPLVIPIDCSLVVDPPQASFSVYTGQSVVLQFAPSTCDTVWWANNGQGVPSTWSGTDGQGGLLSGVSSFTIPAADVPKWTTSSGYFDIDRTGSGDYTSIYFTSGGPAPEPAPDTLPNTGVDGTEKSMNIGLAAFVTLLGIALFAFARRRLS